MEGLTVIEKACPKCHRITRENNCPNCKTSSLSDDFAGLAIIFNPEKSIIAKTMKIKGEGVYALKVR